MDKRIQRTLLFLLPALLLAGLALANCGAPRPGASIQSAIQGRILLWHAWTEQETAVLNEILGRFKEIHPGATIKQQSFASQEELRRAFEAAADSGLGPDLLLGPNDWIRPLADQGFIADISGEISEDILQRYMEATLAEVRYGDGLYGLPQSLNTLALYYNRAIVDTPPRTLDELLAQAAAGKLVTMGTSFYDAFWGVQAFGGQLMDPEGRVILDQGGFANWLAWLEMAREAPGMILDTNRDALRARFLEGGVAYYVGDAREYPTIAESLGSDQVGVAPLPAGPNGPAGPFLSVQAFLFNSASSTNQRRVALEVAQFVTNAEQSATLMRRVGQVPANVQVRINPRLNPVVNSFATQARTAVPVPNVPQMDAVWRLADDAYVKVLEGVLEPAEAAAAVTVAINEANGIPPLAVAEYSCPGPGTIRLAHSLDGADAQVVETLAALFSAQCPGTQVEVTPMSPSALRNSFQAGTDDRQPTLILASHLWVPELVMEEEIRNISGLVNGQILQRYRPFAVDGLRYQNGLYGIPAFFEVSAFYYNRTLVAQPARTLTDLRTQLANGIPVTLDIRFDQAYWGVGAFGGRLFDAQGQILLDDGGFANWLAWLKESRQDFGLRVSQDGAVMKGDFKTGRSAYYVGGPGDLAELREAFLDSELGVSTLPAGPEGEATPFLWVTGYLFNAASSEEQSRMALEFVKYATLPDRQAMAIRMASWLPSNANIDLSSYPHIAVFVDAARSAVLYPTFPQMETVRRLAGSAYQAVLVEGVPPTEAVAAAAAALNEATNPPAASGGRSNDADSLNGQSSGP